MVDGVVCLMEVVLVESGDGLSDGIFPVAEKQYSNESDEVLNEGLRRGKDEALYHSPLHPSPALSCLRPVEAQSRGCNAAGNPNQGNRRRPSGVLGARHFLCISTAVRLSTWPCFVPVNKMECLYELWVRDVIERNPRSAPPHRSGLLGPEICSGLLKLQGSPLIHPC